MYRSLTGFYPIPQFLHSYHQQYATAAAACRLSGLDGKYAISLPFNISPRTSKPRFNTVKLDEYMSKSDIDVAKTKAIGTKKAQADALKYLGLHNDQRLIEVLRLSSYHFYD